MRKNVFFSCKNFVQAGSVFLLFFVAIFSGGCETRVKQPPVKSVTPAFSPYVPAPQDLAVQAANSLSFASQGLRSWQGLEPALVQSLKYTGRKPAHQVALKHENITITWGNLHQSLELLLTLLPHLDNNQELLAKHFIWLRVHPNPLMTGYYVPLLEASPVKTAEYPHPLYAVPKDLKTADLGKFHPRWKGQRLVYRIEKDKIVPYHDRLAIDFNNALADKNLEVAWVKDPTEAFFLHIQGSGMLQFPDGSRRFALYAGKNGLRYASLGREMIRRNLLQKQGVSMQSIKKYLQKNPNQQRELFSTNPSYVFFRLGKDGPFGAMGRKLTPRVSIATDPKVLPLGSMMAFETMLPPQAPEGRPARAAGIGLAQDTGGAIKGARVDFYCGIGKEVEYLAGHLKEPVNMYLLISKEALKK